MVRVHVRPLDLLPQFQYLSAPVSPSQNGASSVSSPICRHAVLPSRVNSPSRRSAASRCIDGKTWLYVSSVIRIRACPSRSCEIVGCTCSLSRSAAAVNAQVRARFKAEPDRTGKALFLRLQARHPDVFPGRPVAFQRRIEEWRRAAARDLVFLGDRHGHTATAVGWAWVLGVRAADWNALRRPPAPSARSSPQGEPFRGRNGRNSPATFGVPISPGVGRNAVRYAARRTGVTDRCGGTHVLRRTAATRMVGAGASLTEIADMLGHRCLDTTAIYTKVDLPRPSSSHVREWDSVNQAVYIGDPPHPPQPVVHPSDVG